VICSKVKFFPAFIYHPAIVLSY